MSSHEYEVVPFDRAGMQPLLDMFETYYREAAGDDPVLALSENWRAVYRQFLGQALGASDRYIRLVVERPSGRHVGFIMGQVVEDPLFAVQRIGYINELYVEPTLRRGGLGRQLVDGFFRWCRGLGLTTVQLNVLVRNPEAVAFWRQLGFADNMLNMARTFSDRPATPSA